MDSTSDQNQIDYHKRLFELDEENNKCVDCHNALVTYLSINNGVTICKECSLKHLDLSSSISYIRKIDDEIDEYLFRYFLYGGNTKFINCLQLFSIETSLEINKKYNTYGVDYYRKNLKAKVKGLKPIENIDFSQGPLLKETMEDDYPEFNDYRIQKQEKVNGMNNIKGFFGKVSTKLSNLNIKEKLNSSKAKTIEKITKVKQYLTSTAEPAKNKIKNGASYLSLSVQSMFNEVKDKITKKKNEPINQGIPNNEQTSSISSNNSSFIPNSQKKENEMPSSVL